jgi:hypothetical protein
MKEKAIEISKIGSNRDSECICKDFFLTLQDPSSESSPVLHFSFLRTECFERSLEVCMIYMHLLPTVETANHHKNSDLK